MRALLLINPNATTVSAEARDMIGHALTDKLAVDTAETQARGHAATLASEAAEADYDLVVVVGGDGTVNEATNGLLAGQVDVSTRPALAVIPGGNANVFARTLGIPATPVQAAGHLLRSLQAGHTRTIGLGTADDRYFTFCAGMGFGAEVIRAVEGSRAAGCHSSPALYIRTALRHYFTVTDRRHPALRIERPGTPSIHRLFMGVVSNANPWTYLGRYPVSPNPLASFDTALDLLALRQLRTVSTLNQIRQFLTPDGRPPRGRHTLALHDLPELTLVASRPMAFQVDGDYVGEREEVRFRSVPNALRVVSNVAAARPV